MKNISQVVSFGERNKKSWRYWTSKIKLELLRLPCYSVHVGNWTKIIRSGYGSICRAIERGYGIKGAKTGRCYSSGTAIWRAGRHSDRQEPYESICERKDSAASGNSSFSGKLSAGRRRLAFDGRRRQPDGWRKYHP